MTDSEVEYEAVAQLGHAALRQAWSTQDVGTRIAWERQAIAHFSEAAHAGHSSSAFNLGVCHSKGLGDFPPNETEAVIWYTRAMDGGDVHGAFNLVHCDHF